MAKQVTFNFIPGDDVFVMDENQVKEGKVKHVGCNINNDGATITYSICVGYPQSVKRSQELVFASKEDLLKSL